MRCAKGAEEFTEFATARSGSLFRTAWLLTGDWHLAEDLVQETLGKMYVKWPKIDGVDESRSRSGRVSFGEGTGFEIRASHDLEGNDLDVWTESCERGASDGKPCTELLNTGEIGVFASTYPNQGNRESLRYVADLADGTLIIVFDNYMETATGKVVGSSISDAGIDPDELVAVVEDSGVLDN